MARVLIVDDEKCIRITMQKFLADVGYDVTVAEDADQALKIMATATCDIVVCDIVMPRVTGISLLKNIKEKWPQVKVIMMTGDPTIESAAESVRASAFDYLAKPVGKDQLLATVNKAVKAISDIDG